MPAPLNCASLPSLRAMVVGLLSLALTVVGWAKESAHHFDIPAGNAAQALKQFALQAEREIVFSPEVVANVRTPAVEGSFTPQEALNRMLADTGLTASRDVTGAFAIRRVPRPESLKGRLGPNQVARDPGEIIALSPFVVSGETAGRYTPTEATSGTRVRVSLMDSPQSVSVVSHELIEDVGATRTLDAVKYVAGVSESTIPNAQDRMNVRGFQTDGATIDGFSFFSYSNVDPSIIDRIEVVKGPNPILSPQIVQGTVNLISKKPFFTDGGSVSLELGRYNADRVEFDTNRVLIEDKLAVRFVGAAQRSHDQAPGNFNHTQSAMPMVTYRVGPKAEITAQVQLYNTYSAAYGGLPIDPTVGTQDRAHLLSGIPDDLDLYGTSANRHSTAQHYRVFFTAQPTENLSVRAAFNAIHWSGSYVAITIGDPLDPATGRQGLLVALDPKTGSWVWTGRTLTNPVFPRVGSLSEQTRLYYNFENEYAYQKNWGANKSTTVAGVMVDYLKNPGHSYGFDVPNLDIYHYAPQDHALGPLTGNGYNINSDQQIYLYEQLSLYHDRFILNGGLVHAWYKSYSSDLYRGMTAQNRPHATLPMLGAIVKPLSNVAVFADTSREDQANGVSPSFNVSPIKRGRQNEVGLRTELFDRHLYTTLTYFNIRQDNFAVPNPANASVPAPNPALPAVLTDLKINGVEWELGGSLTSHLSIVGNATFMRARNPNGQPFRGVAERSAAGWISYAFTQEDALKGLSIGLGIDYLGRRAGDFPSNTPTTASTPQMLILPQPSFWLPSRILVNAAVIYRFGQKWKTALNIDNALNEHYLAASTSRNTVFPGTPINPRVTFTYNF